MPAAERGKDGERVGGFVGWMGLYSLSSTDDEQARFTIFLEGRFVVAYQLARCRVGITIGCLGGMSSSLLVQLHGWCEQPHRTSASVLIYFLGSTITQYPQTLANIGRWIMVHSFCIIHQVCLTIVCKVSMASALARYAAVTSIRQDRQVSTNGSRLSRASLDREWRSLVQYSSTVFGSIRQFVFKLKELVPYKPSVHLSYVCSSTAHFRG